MTSFSVKSFGCRLNQAEAFLWVEEFQEYGLFYNDDFYKSDLIVLNTCTLTSRADRDVRSFIRKISRINPDAKVILTGCFAERESEDLKKKSNIWKIIPNRAKEELPSRVLSHFSSCREQTVKSYRSRALIKIQDGCSYDCTFCIIPSVRGDSVSVGRHKILSRAREYIEKGFHEIILTGVDICLYGLDLKPKRSLLDLLQDFENVSDLSKIRLSSLDPRFIDNKFLKYITSKKHVCPHFHLSLQHGSDKILLRMGRKTKQHEFRSLLEEMSCKSPSAAIGADIIVGFPGETEADFELTYNFLENSPLTYFHVFSYSPRPGTKAAEWTQVNNEVKAKRSASLRELSKKKNRDFRQDFIGKECEAIVIKKDKDEARVLTTNYIDTRVPFCPVNEKEEVKVKIIRINGSDTFGSLV
jgi:threonylcarbamoyladenosine tRNA methylthiotransferase MtaB